MRTYLDFEKPIEELNTTIEKTNEIIPPNLNIASLLSEVVLEVIRSEHAL